MQHGKAFAIAVALNMGMVIAEIIAGIAAGSMALIADAGHNFSDVIGILVAWWAGALAAKPPSGRFTFGYRKSTILAALVSGLLLVFATGGIVWEAINRLLHPSPVEGGWVIVVALFGVFINGISALLFAKSRKGDLNIRGAFLHLMGDAGVSLAVAIAGVILLLNKNLSWVDPAMSLVVAVVILWSTWDLLKEAVFMALDAAPGEKQLAEIRTYLTGLPGVTGIHDLHVWQLSTTEAALMVHIVRPEAAGHDAFLAETREALEEKFGIGHVTIQLERGGAEACEGCVTV